MHRLTSETEILISTLLREPFDYTKWRRDNLYTEMSLSELNQKAAQVAKDQESAMLCNDAQVP